jgi:hypothetical protein
VSVAGGPVAGDAGDKMQAMREMQAMLAMLAMLAMRVLCMYALCCGRCSRCRFSSVEKVWVGEFDSCLNPSPARLWSMIDSFRES